MSAPVHNIEVEQQVLGAILINNRAYGAVAGLLEPEQFFEPIHQEIYRAAGAEIAGGRVVTPATLRAIVPDVDIAGMSTSTYLNRLAAHATTIINAPDFARSIVKFWERRQIAAIGAMVAQPDQSSTQAVQDAYDAIDALRAQTTKRPGQSGSLGSFARKVVDNIAKPADELLVPSTGFSDLDRFLGGGYRPGRLYVVAGRPGMGKTVFGITSARRVAMKGYGVAFFTLEIDGEELASRAIAASLATSHEPVEYSNVIQNRLTDQQRLHVSQAAEHLHVYPFEIEGGSVSMLDIDWKMQTYVRQWAHRGIKPGLVVIDYMGLVKPSDRYRGRRVDEQGEIAAAGKHLSSKFGVGVLMLAQLNRGVESRDDKRPAMSDLRDSGNIEEHADVVALLYRPAYYDQRDPKVRDGDVEAMTRAAKRAHHLEIALGKNRIGPTTTVTLWCDVGANSVDNRGAGR